MNFTSKSHYALKIMLDLAYYYYLPHVHRKDVAKRQCIPVDYLDQIMIKLRAAGLVKSIRGRGGGYKLSNDPKNVTIWDIVNAVENNIGPVNCTNQDPCEYETFCISTNAWKEIFKEIKNILTSKTLYSVVDKWKKSGKMLENINKRELSQESKNIDNVVEAVNNLV